MLLIAILQYRILVPHEPTFGEYICYALSTDAFIPSTTLLCLPCHGSMEGDAHSNITDKGKSDIMRIFPDIGRITYGAHSFIRGIMVPICQCVFNLFAPGPIATWLALYPPKLHDPPGNPLGALWPIGARSPLFNVDGGMQEALNRSLCWWKHRYDDSPVC